MTRFTTLFQSSTFRVAGAVAVLAATAPLALPGQAAEDIKAINCARSSRVEGSGIWQRFTAPTFAPGLDVGPASQEVRSFAVSPLNSHYAAVTNGNSVYVSADAGCSWRVALQLSRVPDPQLKLSGALTTIKSVFVTGGRNGGVTYFALAEELETGATVGRPHVLRSTTGEIGSWELADEGLPPLGEALAMRVHPTNQNVIYLTFRNAREDSSQCPPPPLPVPCDSQPGRRLGLMYRSLDNGRTWESRTNPSDLNTTFPIRYVSVDDDDPNGNLVWVVSNRRLWKSRDGGATFEQPDGLDQEGFEFTAVESLANTRNSDGLQLVAFSSDGEMVRLSRTRGWVRSTVYFGAVASVVQRPEGDIAVVTRTVDGGYPTVWRIFPRDFVDFENEVGIGGRKFKLTFGWEGISPPDEKIEPTITGGHSRAGGGTYYVRSGRQLLRFLGSKARLGNEEAPPIEFDAPKPPRGRISPSSIELDIPLGKSETVPYTLTLPPSPTPLDLYLLVDNSGSMLPFINDLKTNLGDVAQALHKTGVDVGIGVGQLNVEPDRQSLPLDDPRTPEEDESKLKPIYQRLRPIGPINADLFAQLSKLDGAAGSGQEPHLEALYQSVAGTGLQTDLSVLLGTSIPPGHDADFRDPLMPIKVIVHATDENFTGTDTIGNRGNPQDATEGKNAHNDFGSVAAALRDRGVKHIGLAINEAPDAEEDLKKMAELTKTFAPAGGVDCDGDGFIGPDDVRPGQPLVCGQTLGLDRTLVNLLQSLSDPATISLSKKPSATFAELSREEIRIDAKKPTTAPFTGTFSCKNVGEGSYVDDLTASLRGVEIAKATVVVNCGGPPAQGPRNRIIETNEPPANPPPAQPQPVVPAPVPVNPVPQPQAQAQGQTQVNPQSGMADQEEQQLQLAAAGQEMQEDEQLAMSGLRYEDAAIGVVGVGMAMASAFGAVALRRRSRTAAAKVTVRH